MEGTYGSLPNPPFPERKKIRKGGAAASYAGVATKSQDPRSRKQGNKRGVVGGRQPPTKIDIKKSPPNV